MLVETDVPRDLQSNPGSAASTDSPAGAPVRVPRRRPMAAQHGVLLIDKPPGCTSHDVVMQARSLLREKKIGHCGTLDPDATGLLLLTVGQATRLTRFLIQAPKVYSGSIRFGLTTDTYDLSGQVVRTGTTDQLTAAAVHAAMESFVGAYAQTPPPYCAKKIHGVKYYELARRGEEVPQEKKEVMVFAFHADAEWRSGEDLPFTLSCSSGTYARSLVHELGQQLGCGAALGQLRRTRIGPFTVDHALTLDALSLELDAGENLGAAWIPLDAIPLPFGEVVADAQQEQRLQHGQNILVRDLAAGQEGDWVKVLDRRQRLIAVGAIVEKIGSGNLGVIQPKVVFRS